MSTIRTRFAPSPTGFLHVGSLRTALYNYLLAKKHGGQFVLRIEDTDQSRLVPGSVENMIDSLRWAGIDFDEGPGKGGPHAPYTQSERLDLYKKHAQELIDKDLAYHCFCSSERLENVRQRQIALKMPPAYDRHCRDLSKDEVAKRLANNETSVIRMKIPLEGAIIFKDLIRGKIEIAYKAVDDQVLIKSDGFPTYHLAVVVDDHYMEISHVIRGEEWLPSTPKHLLLYLYFGWQAPHFAHLPLLLNPDKSKLSKRQGDVSVDDYRLKGYLPEALVNFIALLGWNPGDVREIFSLPELIQEFSLERVGKAGAIFNLGKLQWINQQYIMHMDNKELLKRVLPYWKEKGWDLDNSEHLEQIIGLVKERAITLPDLVTLGEYFFVAPSTFDPTGIEKWTPESAAHIKKLTEQFSALATFDAPALEHAVREYAKENNLNPGKFFPPLRLAVTGIIHGPSIFMTMQVLGKKETMARLEFALKTLGQ
jgi:glutamyl-tRNA synthetase